MYEIYARYYIANPVSNQKEAKDICIYNDKIQSDSLKVVDPKLVLTDSAAGSLDITLPLTNVGYDLIERMTTDITVKKDGVDIWFGRVLSESTDFWKNRVLTCEGALAFLNDTIQPQVEYEGVKVREFLTSMLNEHNKYVDDNRKIDVGAVTVGVSTIDGEDDPVYDFYTNYETTLYSLNLLKENLGGHMRIRITNAGLVLDYLKDSINARRQTISFGKNLVDFTSSWGMDEFATAILPLGAKLTKNEIKSADAYLTVKDADNGQGGKYNSIYVENAEAVSNFGWIAKTVKFDDVTDPNVLLEQAQEYLSSMQFENMVLEVSAFDLHYLDNDIEAIELLDKIHVISPPHGLDDWFLITELEIPLDSPEKTQFKMGSNIKTSLTETNNKNYSEIHDKINFNGRNSLLRSARENADELINNATSGYITIVKNPTRGNSDALYISDDEDYTASNRYWIWNLNGLAYYDNAWMDGSRPYPSSYHDAGYDEQGKPLPLFAITMDGAIVADAITTGILDANVIRTGVLMDPPIYDTDRSIKSAELINLHNGKGVVKFYTTISTTGSPAFTYDVTVTDQTRMNRYNHFIWDQNLFPETVDPGLNNKQVFVLVTPNEDDYNQREYVFLNAEFYESYQSANNNLNGKPVFVLTHVNGNDGVHDVIHIVDEYFGSNTIFNLDNGDLVMKRGHIKLGAYDKNSEHYKFEVDSDGNVYAGSGVFAGRLAAATGSFKGELLAATGDFEGIVRASDFQDKRGRSMMSIVTGSSDQYNDSKISLGVRGQTLTLDGATGSITMSGNLNLSNLSQITWNAEQKPVLENDLESDVGDIIDFDYINNKMGEAFSLQNNPNKFVSINSKTIQAPNIVGGTIWGVTYYGNAFNIRPYDGNTSGAFNLFGTENANSPAFSISYDQYGAVIINGLLGGHLRFNINIGKMLLREDTNDAYGGIYGNTLPDENSVYREKGELFFKI